MSEPAYILHNGKRVPYIPKEITDHRAAYAATLHVLFKHVADFHICVVKAFSKKYGIPEDDIMQTIQESDEFKNMVVDPVLDPSDPLGYLTQEPTGITGATIATTATGATTATATTAATTATTATATTATATTAATTATAAATGTATATTSIKKIVKKKQPVVVEPVVVVVEPVVVVVAPVVVAPVVVDEPVKKKIIRKKVAPEKQAPEATEATETTETTEERNERNEGNEHVPDISLMTHATTSKKIIRKKK